MQRLKIIFAGTPAFAAEHLRVLLEQSKHEVVAVYTQPDRPSGRGKKLTTSAVKALALAEDIPVYQPLSLKDEVAQLQMAELHADIMVVVAYGLILPKSVLAVPPLGCINVHASLLPRWRGAAPIQRAIEAGDEQTGITIMQMDEGLDTGPMLNRVSCAISETDTAASLQDKLAVSGAAALLMTLDAFADPGNQPTAEQQDDTLATYAHKITKQEARLDWHQPAQMLDSQVRAFHPVPVAFTTLGKDTLRIWQAKAVTYPHQAAAGSVLSCDSKGILVACHTDALLLTEVQLPGKRRMAVSDLLQGRAAMFAPGTQLGI
jgi:methionyl-tRNA formyltransferase